jgi:hypothetical protein
MENLFNSEDRDVWWKGLLDLEYSDLFDRSSQCIVFNKYNATYITIYDALVSLASENVDVVWYHNSAREFYARAGVDYYQTFSLF